LRRLLSFPCEGAELGASLDGGGHDDEDGRTGLLFVTGGTQTRIGSHRLFERLAFALAGAGTHCLRFDRRGVGDSGGTDPGWAESGADIAAAASAFRREVPQLAAILGIGLCDGASALALHGSEAGLAGLILVNPWLVEAESGAPPAAAVKDHYRRQLSSLAGWKRLLTGSVSYKKILKGLLRIAAPPPADLASRIAAAIVGANMPVRLLLARGDATAIGALAEWQSEPFAKVRSRGPAPVFIESDSHTFARPGDFEALQAACLAAIAGLSGGR
jgi:exosortase A-associated hydrolase 1